MSFVMKCKHVMSHMQVLMEDSATGQLSSMGHSGLQLRDTGGSQTVTFKSQK